jgi:hypothetical protein
MQFANPLQPARRLWAAWLAVLLALFAALAPTVSHAIAFTRAGDHAGVEICTSTGPQWLAAPDAAASADDESPGKKTASQVEHCPFCLLQADRVAPVSLPVVFHFGGAGNARVDPVPQSHFYSTYFALAPPPRGPPEFLLLLKM